MNEHLVGAPLDITVDAIVNWMDEVGSQLIGDAQGLAPHILYSVVFVVLGFVAAMLVRRVVTQFFEHSGIDEFVEETMGDDTVLDDRTVGELLGRLAAIYIYLLTALVVAQELSLGPAVSALNGVIGFLPTAVVALVVLAAGFWLGDVVKERVAGSASETGEMGEVFGMAVQVFVYVIAVVVAFSVLAGTSGGAGFAIPIMQVFALGFALAFVLAIGWAAKEFLDVDRDDVVPADD